MDTDTVTDPPEPEAPAPERPQLEAAYSDAQEFAALPEQLQALYTHEPLLRRWEFTGLRDANYHPHIVDMRLGAVDSAAAERSKADAAARAQALDAAALQVRTNGIREAVAAELRAMSAEELRRARGDYSAAELADLPHAEYVAARNAQRAAEGLPAL